MTAKQLNPLLQPVPPATAIDHELLNYENHEFMNIRSS
jgi:hypothetical protein